MYSWMSATIYFFTVTLFIIGCVPPSYRTVPNTHNNNKSSQNQYNSDDIQIVPFDDNYYIENEQTYSTQPVYYTVQHQNKKDSSILPINEQPIIKSNSSSKWHVIKKGETLYSIAKHYGISVNELCSANSISNPSLVKVGQKIIIPALNGFHNSSPNNTTKAAPQLKQAVMHSFIWPVSVITYTHDLQRGTRPLGITITSLPKCQVVASANGKIVKIGHMRGYGNFVVIMHQKDFYTIYSKLDFITVKEGQAIKRGSPIGFLSDSNPRLHFQINHSGKPLDPLHYLAKQ